MTRYLLKQVVGNKRKEMYKDKTTDYTYDYNTPLYLFNYLNKHFKFELDPCATKDNYLQIEHYCTLTEGHDGLDQEWSINTFVNPPYGFDSEKKWIEKALSEFIKYEKNIFLLLPAKTEAPWFSKLFEMSSVIIFPQSRISFIKDGKKMNSNTMGSVIFGLVNLFRPVGSMNEYNENGRQYLEFRDENIKLNIPCIELDEGGSIFFPGRNVLEKNFT